ncbi:hypothetical protein [Streptomyces sp. MJP52]|uniref:hypothetical protein n=1 Tax=Streptomyces sp. MJP52 TaxID=2940555 RepID=UPI00247569C9|nr:hypothetical protein [Streptomyces sp. MJP52]MDH6226036.1 hypothetical protein [Streptomyces sp. MJP52]
MTTERPVAGPRESLAEQARDSAGPGGPAVGGGGARPRAWARPFAPRALLTTAMSVPLVLGLPLLLPLVVMNQPGGGVRDTAYWLQAGLTAYCGTRLCAMILARRRKLLQATFWMFCYMAMGVAPLAQAVLGRVPTPVVGPREDLVLAIALVLFGCCAFDLGALLARFRPPWRRREAEEERDDRGGAGGGAEDGPGDRPRLVHRRRVHLLTLAAFAAAALLVVRLGGPAVFFSSRQEITAGLEDAGLSGNGSEAGQAFVRGFGTVLPLIALLVHVRMLVTSRRARRSWSTVAVLVSLCCLNAVVNNPISNPRYWFLTVMFALLFTAFPVSAALYRMSLTLGVVVALLLFPFADAFRYEENNTRPIETTSFLEPLALKDYDQIGMFANTITYVDSAGHTYGNQLAGCLLFAVPRSVWEGKPVDTGVMVGQWMGTRNTNLSSPVWAELYVDFGAVGMTAGLGLVGYAAARFDRRVARASAGRRGHPGRLLLVVAPLIAGYSFILLRGPLLQATGRVAIAAMCLLFVTTRHADRAVPGEGPGGRPRSP